MQGLGSRDPAKKYPIVVSDLLNQRMAVLPSHTDQGPKDSRHEEPILIFAALLLLFRITRILQTESQPYSCPYSPSTLSQLGLNT